MLILLELLRFGGDCVNANSCVTIQKQKRFNERLELLEASTFAKNISQILLSISMKETGSLGYNSFMQTMIGQCIVMFIESRMRYSRTSHD